MPVYENKEEIEEEYEENEDISDETKSQVQSILEQFGEGGIQVEEYDPETGDPPPEGTVILKLNGSGEVIEVTTENIGNTPILDGSDSSSGIRVDLSGELEMDEGSYPESRVVIGTDFNDVVIGGRSDLTADLGDGVDKVTTGDGDDTVFMGEGDDTVRIGGGGNDFIDGGDGNDGLAFSGQESDWTRADNEDGSTTWTNVNTGQTVTTINVEGFSFGGFDEEQTDEQSFDDPDPEDI